ncbi:MAG: Plug domain-containing protein [Burkholderiales bacterium]|nr:MAG: Plug domain-containing protein [Burkholderiales bacterium]
MAGCGYRHCYDDSHGADLCRQVRRSVTSWVAKALIAFTCLYSPAVGYVAPGGIDTAPNSSDRVIYEADFYTKFQPQTALDILQRTPGFVLSAPDDGGMLRGFSSNAGNVVIDGQRPTVKSGGLTAYLGRISAARVQRVDLIRGALMGEAQGQTLVANLVLVEDGGRSGNASLELRRAPADRITPKVEASYAIPQKQRPPYQPQYHK